MGRDGFLLIFMEGLQKYNAGSGLVEILQKDLFFLVVVGVFFLVSEKTSETPSICFIFKKLSPFHFFEEPWFFTNMFSGIYSTKHFVLKVPTVRFG